ncbi:hypothetical protein EV363DRAFT_596381 [Boletus edulis]|nr:hypothetical protein EV363DRAFT_596381 [Boletus edulis]
MDPPPEKRKPGRPKGTKNKPTAAPDQRRSRSRMLVATQNLSAMKSRPARLIALVFFKFGSVFERPGDHRRALSIFYPSYMNGIKSPMPSPRLALGFDAIHPATQMILSLPTLSSRAIYMSDMASSSTWWSPTAGGDRATWAVDGFLDREAMDLHLKGQLDRTMSTNNFAEIVKGISSRLEPAEVRTSFSTLSGETELLRL